MTYRQVVLALCAVFFLIVGQGAAFSVECAVCERNYADCRLPAQQKLASCMNSGKSDCGAKCSNDCKNDKEAQKCTLNCVKSCQSGSGSCQATFASANTQCTNTLRTCKTSCTR